MKYFTNFQLTWNVSIIQNLTYKPWASLCNVVIAESLRKQVNLVKIIRIIIFIEQVDT